jgi:hypothetical protein
MHLKAWIIVFIINCFSEHAFSSNDSAQAFKSTYFPDLAKPTCKFMPEDNNNVDIIPHLSAVGLNVDLNQRKHFNKLLRRISDSQKSQPSDQKRGLRRPKYPDRYSKAIISNKELTCSYQASYRLTGDYSDHNDLALSSIKVKIKDGSLGGIQKFKLFVPDTRNGKSEVFSTYLFRQLGFLSPRTAIIDVKLNGSRLVTRIFQEDLDEGFLEHNKMQGSFIFGGHEEHGLSNTFSVPVIRNEKLIDNNNDGILAESILYQLTRIYLKTSLASIQSSALSSSGIDSDPDPVVNPDYFPKRSREDIQLFTMLSTAMSGKTGISKDDSRFAYDTFSEKLRPIYYDGHIPDYTPILEGNQLGFPWEIKLENKRKLVNRLMNLNSTIVAHDLLALGAKYSSNEIEKKIKTIIHNINGQYSTLVGNPRMTNHINIMQLLPIWIDGNNQEQQLFLIKLGDNSYQRCVIKINTQDVCTEIYINHEPIGLSRLLVSQELGTINKGLEDAIFIDASPVQNRGNTLVKRIQSSKLPGVEFIVSQNVLLKILKENRTIQISRNYSADSYGDSQVHVRGGSMEGWIILVEPNTLGYQSIDMKKSTSQYLSGCLTFSDVNLSKVSIKIDQSNCEDAIHFFRVTATQVKGDVRQSRSDSIDSDFSAIEFSSLTINGAGNDCIDLSAGKYNIRTASISDCSDKGISAGENSSVNVQQLFIDRAGIGVAAKDSSDVRVGRYLINDTAFCFAAYQKKTNYFGGTLNLGNGECTESRISRAFEQDGSKVRFHQPLK